MGKSLPGLIRMGRFRPVHCKSVSAQELRALIGARRTLQKSMISIELSMRGMLRGLGLKLGQITRWRLPERARELSDGNEMLMAMVTAMLRCHAADPAKRAAEAEPRLKRLYDAIQAGMADLDDPSLRDRIDGLKAICDQARTEKAPAQALMDQASNTAVTPQMLIRFAAAARDRLRLPGGGFRRDHLRAQARRVEVADGEVRIIGSKS